MQYVITIGIFAILMLGAILVYKFKMAELKAEKEKEDDEFSEVDLAIKYITSPEYLSNMKGNVTLEELPTVVTLYKEAKDEKSLVKYKEVRKLIRKHFKDADFVYLKKM